MANTCLPLGQANKLARAKALEFQASFAKKKVAPLGYEPLKFKYPFHGFVRCEVEDNAFLMFSANDDVVAWRYFWLGANGYEPELLGPWAEAAKSARVILDIGAYTGLVSIVSALVNPECVVHAFEPMPRTVERLWVNLRINGVADRVTMHNFAASDSDGQDAIHLYRDENFLGTGNSIDRKTHVEPTHTVEIRKKRIDACKFKNVDLIKIDTEGHEVNVLEGARKLLKKCRPAMFVEVWPQNQQAVFAITEELGYARRHLGGMNWFFEQEQKAEQPSSAKGKTAKR